jgi:hypothetical protein
MKAVRFLGITALVLALFLGLSFQTAAAAKLPVPVNIFGMATDGKIDTENYTQVFLDGTTNTNFVLPSGKVLIIQSIFVNFNPTSPPFTPPVKFIIENSTGTSPNIFTGVMTPNSNNTAAALQTTFSPGLAINIKPVMKVVDSDGNLVSGTLKVRFFGIVQ